MNILDSKLVVIDLSTASTQLCAYDYDQETEDLDDNYDLAMDDLE
jgi:hypothetical protein